MAVISHGLWRGRFGADPAILQRTIHLNERVFGIVGLMPEGFAGVSFDTDVWVPSMMVTLRAAPTVVQNRGTRWLGAIGRLREGVTIERAQEDLNRVAAILEERYPDVIRERGVQLADMRQALVGNTREDKEILEGPASDPNDPRAQVSQTDLEAQQATAPNIRDAFTGPTRIVTSLRHVRAQLDSRAAAVKAQTGDLVKAISDTIAKIDRREGRMHNPTAEVSYDILAMRGGTRLYSRISPLIGFASWGNGAPTQGVREVYAGQKKELDACAVEANEIFANDIAAINALAAKLGVSFVVKQAGAAAPAPITPSASSSDSSSPHAAPAASSPRRPRRAG